MNHFRSVRLEITNKTLMTINVETAKNGETVGTTSCYTDGRSFSNSRAVVVHALKYMVTLKLIVRNG